MHATSNRSTSFSCQNAQHNIPVVIVHFVCDELQNTSYSIIGKIIFKREPLSFFHAFMCPISQSLYRQETLEPMARWEKLNPSIPVQQRLVTSKNNEKCFNWTRERRILWRRDCWDPSHGITTINPFEWYGLFHAFFTEYGTDPSSCAVLSGKEVLKRGQSYSVTVNHF